MTGLIVTATLNQTARTRARAMTTALRPTAMEHAIARTRCCPQDPEKTTLADCGCGVPDLREYGRGVPAEYQDGDGIHDCLGRCPGFDDRQDEDANGIPDGCEGPTWVNMAYIAAGAFTMGDTLNEGATVERPVHAVPVSGFYLDQTEITESLWDQVYDIATPSRIALRARGTSQPAIGVAWNDAHGETSRSAGCQKLARPVRGGAWGHSRSFGCRRASRLLY